MNEYLTVWADSAGHWLLAWAVVVAGVAALRAVCRPRRSSVRYGGWLLATFSGVGLLLIVFVVSPVVTWKEITARFGGPPPAQEGNLVKDLTPRFEPGAIHSEAGWPLGTGVPSASTSEKDRSTLSQPMAASIPGTPVTAGPDALGTSAVTQPDRNSISVISVVMWAWVAGTTFLLARLARHWWLARRLVRTGLAPVSREIADAYQAMRKRLGMSREVRLAAHAEITTPVCVGVVRPVMLWPAAENDRFSPRERDAAMAHELAHLRRHDEWVNLASELWRAVTWFFLPVHWTVARLRREQEFLCDDLAARELESPADYAQMLLKLAPVRIGPNALCFELGQEARAGRRVRRLINPEMRCILPPSRVQTVLLTVLALSLVVGAGSLSLVGFSDRPIAVAAPAEPEKAAVLETELEDPFAELEDPFTEDETADVEPTDAASKGRSPRPEIVQVYPADGASGVAPDTEIRVRFDRPMDPYLSHLKWQHDSEGGFRPRGELRYLEETREFILPVRLSPGCSHEIELNEEDHFEEGEYAGFSSVDQVAAKTYSWSFTTAVLPTAPDERRAKVVAVEPASDSEVPLLTLLRVKFDRPMDPTWFGMADQGGRGSHMEKPNLHQFVEYDSERYEFTLPMKLPANWNGEIKLIHFRDRDGIEAVPMSLKYRTAREPAGQGIQERVAAAGKSADLLAMVDKIRAARAEITSISEEVSHAITFAGKPSWLSSYQSTGATFKMRGDRRFAANIDQIMGGTFRVGSDGTSCWTRRKDGLFSCPYEEVAEKNLLFSDPFRAFRLDDTVGVVERMRLEYLGQVVLDGRPCHRIRSWNVKFWSAHIDLLMPVLDWYIDAESLLPVRIDSDGVPRLAFRNVRVNQPIAEEEFRPDTDQDTQLKDLDPLDEDYTKRFLNVIDGSSGRMSVRFGKRGPKGTSSSGLN